MHPDTGCCRPRHGNSQTALGRAEAAVVVRGTDSRAKGQFLVAQEGVTEHAKARCRLVYLKVVELSLGQLIVKLAHGIPGTVSNTNHHDREGILARLNDGCSGVKTRPDETQ